MAGHGETLGPTAAGRWYPADRAGLERQLDGLFDETQTTEAGPAPVAALIAPHAGFVYSGSVAAQGFRQLHAGAYDRVVLLGPSHYAAIEGACVPRAATYLTPLGDVPIDATACRELGRQAGFRVDDEPFRPEHSLEAEIPFLQRRLHDGWSLVPVLVGMFDRPSAAARIAAGLRPLLVPRTLVVVSSDFTHYGPRFDYVPFEKDISRSIESLDMGAVERILDRDPAGFAEYVARTGATICGRNPISVLLHLLPDGPRGRLAAYDTSGRITGEWDHSVSYASLVFHAARP